MKITTKDTEGRPNGWLMTIWNALEDPEFRPDQVYVTAIAPRSLKGPHLHMVRRGFFAFIHGSVKLRLLVHGEYFECVVKPDLTPSKVIVPAGIPCALYNYGDTEALVLNMPAPAWSKEEPDDHPVSDWKHPQDWPPQDTERRKTEIICGKCQHEQQNHDSGGCCTISFCVCCKFERIQEPTR